MIWLWCDQQSDFNEVFSCKIALTNTGSALPLVSFWTSPISLFRTFLFPFLMALTYREAQQTQNISNVQTNQKNYVTTSENLHVSPHLIRVQVHHLLADAVQLFGVTNKAQVQLLDDLQGCFAWWLPHLLKHLRAERNQVRTSMQTSPSWGVCIEWHIEGDNCMVCTADSPAQQPKRRYVLFPGVPAAQPGQKER